MKTSLKEYNRRYLNDMDKLSKEQRHRYMLSIKSLMKENFDV